MPDQVTQTESIATVQQTEPKSPLMEAFRSCRLAFGNQKNAGQLFGALEKEIALTLAESEAKEVASLPEEQVRLLRQKCIDTAKETPLIRFGTEFGQGAEWMLNTIVERLKTVK